MIAAFIVALIGAYYSSREEGLTTIPQQPAPPPSSEQPSLQPDTPSAPLPTPDVNTKQSGKVRAPQLNVTTDKGESLYGYEKMCEEDPTNSFCQ